MPRRFALLVLLLFACQHVSPPIRAGEDAPAEATRTMREATPPPERPGGDEAAEAAESVAPSDTAGTGAEADPEGTGGFLEAEEFSEGLIDRATVIAAAKEATPEAYPNADEVLLDDYIRVRYRADGRAVSWDDTYLKVLTEKGKRENQSLRFYFTLPYSVTEVKRLEVIRPDGTVVPVDVARQSRVIADSSQLAQNITNPNRKILEVGIPRLEIGDVVHYIVVRKETKPRVPGMWSDYQVLEYTAPIRRFVYEVLAPEERPLHSIALKDEIPETVAYVTAAEDGWIRYRWEARDVPRMYEEPAMPPLHTVVQRLLVSTAGDWGEISRWYWNLSQPALAATTPEMEATVAEIVGGLEERTAKIEALFRWVSQEVRYLGVTAEAEAPGYEPHPVEMTFERRHGVCRDKAALLVAMLRLAGFEAFPVLIHNGPKKDPEVPSLYFNHAVAAVREPDGTYRLMDPTDETTRRLFPAYLGNQSYLVATPGGEGLRTSPVVPADENLMRIETTGRLGPGGALSAESVLRFDGINDNVYRGYFSNITPEERRRYFEGKIKEIVPGAELTHYDLTPANLQDTATPLVARLRFEGDDVLVARGDTAMLPLPRLGTRVGIVNFLLRQTGLEQRNYPLVTDVACGVEETVRIEMDAEVGAVEALPEFEPIAGETTAWTHTVSKEGGSLLSESRFLLTVPEFSPEQYLGLKEALGTIEYNERKMPIFRRTTDAAALPDPDAPDALEADADAIILDWTTEFELEDDTAWTETSRVRTKVLTYAGRRRHAELTIHYNPAWEAVEILEARVRAPDGTEHELSEQEVNELDAPWAGRAPRYPGGKILVAGFPGVEEGAVIEYAVRRRVTDRPFFAGGAVFRAHDPIRRRTLRLRMPGDMPAPSILQERLRGIASMHESADGARIYTWRAENVPLLKRERHMPPLWSFNPSVFVSTGNWADYAGEVHAALMAAAETSTAARAKARELLREISAPHGVVGPAILRDFVARAVQPAGPGLHELPLAAISPADVTLADGYGHSADRAVLLYAMLREIFGSGAPAVGMAAPTEVDLVLASWSPREESLQATLRRHPDPALFPDILVRLRQRTADGVRTVYLNDTDQYARLGATAHDGRLGLELPSGRFVVIRATPDQETRTDVGWRIDLDEEGTAEIRRVQRYYGTDFMQQNKRFAEMPPEERRRYHQELVGDVSQAAEPVGDLRTDFQAYPGEMAFSVRVPRFAVRDGAHLYFQLPASLAGLFRFRSDTRENPLYWSEPTRILLRTVVTLPERFADVRLRPAGLEWRAPLGSGLVRAASATILPRTATTGAPSADPKRIRLETTQTATLEPAVYPAHQYDRLLGIQAELDHARARMVLLDESAAAAEDAREVEVGAEVEAGAEAVGAGE